MAEEPSVPHAVAAENLPEVLQGAHPLKYGAKVLLSQHGREVGRFKNDENNKLSRKHVARRVRASAEFTRQVQLENHDRIMSLVHRMKSAGEWDPLIYLEHSEYDETRLDICLQFEDEARQERQLGKVFMLETQWSMLLRRRIGSWGEALAATGGQDNQSELFTLEGYYCPQIRGTGSGTGETICRVLESTAPAPATAASPLFQCAVRLSETDEDGANARAEAIFGSKYRPKWIMMQMFCLAHKVHLATKQSFSLQQDTVSGLIHAAKHLTSAAAMLKLKEAVTALVPQRLEILDHDVTDAEGQEFRKQILEWFMPPLKQPRRRAVCVISSQFLNGDWRRTKTLQHVCTGSSCCTSRQDSITKCIHLVKRMVSACAPQILNRANWADWSTALNFFGMAGGVHEFVMDCYQLAFSKDPGRYLQVREEEGGVVIEGQAADAFLDMDFMERERAENALSLQKGLDFMQPGLVERIVVLRASLSPEKELMASLLHNVSRTWEAEQVVAEAEHRTREFRVTQMHRGVALQKFLVETWRLFTQSELWRLFACTESFYTTLLKCMMRPAATVYQLVVVRVRLFPYKLFGLLDAGDDRELFAAALLESRRTPCLMDRFSATFLGRYDTVNKLLSPESIGTLALLATKIQLTTYSTERLHSKNLRRSKARVIAKRATLHHLALAHAGWSGPEMLWPEEEGHHRNNRPGRPRKHDPRSSAEEGADKTKIRGGGGPWRAFVHLNLGGRPMEPQVLKLLAAQYRALRPHEFAYYQQIGEAGPLLVCY